MANANQYDTVTITIEVRGTEIEATGTERDEVLASIAKQMGYKAVGFSGMGTDIGSGCTLHTLTNRSSGLGDVIGEVYVTTEVA